MESEGGYGYFILVKVDTGKTGGAILGHIYTDQSDQIFALVTRLMVTRTDSSTHLSTM